MMHESETFKVQSKNQLNISKVLIRPAIIFHFKFSDHPNYKIFHMLFVVIVFCVNALVLTVVVQSMSEH